LRGVGSVVAVGCCSRPHLLLVLHYSASSSCSVVALRHLLLVCVALNLPGHYPDSGGPCAVSERRSVERLSVAVRGVHTLQAEVLHTCGCARTERLLYSMTVKIAGRTVGCMCALLLAAELTHMQLLRMVTSVCLGF
jgi:hypothetical protein